MPQVKPLCKRSLVIREKASGPMIPTWPRAWTIWRRCTVLRGNVRRPSRCTNALWRFRKSPRTGSSRRGREPEQPCGAVPISRPLCSGRAAVQAALTIREKSLGPDNADVATSLSDLAECTTPKAGMRRPSRYTIARWRSMKKPSDRIIPAWLLV